MVKRLHPDGGIGTFNRPTDVTWDTEGNAFIGGFDRLFMKGLNADAVTATCDYDDLAFDLHVSKAYPF